MSTLKFLLAAGALAASSGTASAAVVWASEVIGINGAAVVTDSTATPGDRTDPDNALNNPDDVFYAPGIGGSIDLGFGQTFNQGGSAIVFEVTFGFVPDHLESAEIFAFYSGGDGLFYTGDDSLVSLGTILNTDAQDGQYTFAYNGIFDAIRVQDTSSNPPSNDGFDVDAVGVNPIPLPAAGLLLLGGLAGLGALKRKKA